MTKRDILNLWIDYFNKGDAPKISGLYADDAINHQVVKEPVCGKNSIYEMFVSEFSNMTMICIPENIFEDRDWIILEWKDPNGLRGCGFFQILNEKIQFQRGYFDQNTFLNKQTKK